MKNCAEELHDYGETGQTCKSIPSYEDGQVDVVIQANGIAANVVTVADPITGPDFGRRNEPLQPILIPKLPQLTQFLNADPGIVLSRRGTMPCYFPTDNLFLSS